MGPAPRGLGQAARPTGFEPQGQGPRRTQRAHGLPRVPTGRATRGSGTSGHHPGDHLRTGGSAVPRRPLTRATTRAYPGVLEPAPHDRWHYAGEYLHNRSVSHEATAMDQVFKALADPTRRRLLDRLREHNGQTLRELCDRLDMARQSATQHLDILERGRPRDRRPARTRTASLPQSGTDPRDRGTLDLRVRQAPSASDQRHQEPGRGVRHDQRISIRTVLRLRHLHPGRARSRCGRP